MFYEATPNYIYSNKVAARIYQYKPSIKLIVLLRNPVDRAYSSWNMYHNFFLNKKIPDMLSKSPVGESAHFLYKYLFEERTDFPSFHECIAFELEQMQSNNLFEDEPSFIRKGIYFLQLSEYYKYFSKDQLLIFGFNEFVKNKLEVLHKIENFLGVSHFNFNNAKNVLDKVVIKKQKVRYADKIDDRSKDFLTDYYQVWNKKLFELLGRQLDW